MTRVVSLVPPGLPRRSLVRALLGLVVALAQVGCQSAAYLTMAPGQVRVVGVTMEPQFVATGASLPATVRYWTVEGGRANVRWGKITAGENCDLCASCTREGRPGVLTESPEVLVMRRSMMSDKWEETVRFAHDAGCGSGPSATFVPPTSADYAVALQFPGDPVPTPSVGDPATRFEVMRLNDDGVELPLRRLTRVAGTPTWTWQVARIGTTHIKEAFDPGLHVAQVRIFQATCGEPNGDECAVDATGVGAVAATSIRAGDAAGTDRLCRADEKGAIDFGMRRVAMMTSTCLPEDRHTFFTPAYRLIQTGEAQSATIPWTVELSPDVVAGLPEAVLNENGSTWLWIQFTLERSR